MNTFYMVLLFIYGFSVLLNFLLLSRGTVFKKHPRFSIAVIFLPIVNTCFFISAMLGLILDYKKENGSKS
jgi:hypothetical protein